MIEGKVKMARKQVRLIGVFGLTVIEIADDDGGALLGEEESSGTTDTLTREIVCKNKQRILLVQEDVFVCMRASVGVECRGVVYFLYH